MKKRPQISPIPSDSKTKSARICAICGHKTSHKKVLPIRHAVRVADERSRRHRTRCYGLPQELQSGLVRRLVRLATVHLAVSEHAVLPIRPSAPRARDDVIDIPLAGLERTARVLANTAIALPQ